MRKPCYCTGSFVFVNGLRWGFTRIMGLWPMARRFAAHKKMRQAIDFQWSKKVQQLAVALDFGWYVLCCKPPGELWAIPVHASHRQLGKMNPFKSPMNPKGPSIVKKEALLTHDQLRLASLRGSYALKVISGLPGAGAFGDPPRIFHRENTPAGAMALRQVLRLWGSSYISALFVGGSCFH